MFTRILVVVDGSPTSRFAVDASFTLAREDRSPLVFCVSVDPELCVDVGGEFAAFGEIALGRSQHLLDDALGRARDAGVPDATGVVVRDKPGPAIVGLARERGAGMIVLGVEPRVGFLRPFIRDLADDILRRSAIPLCVMRRPARGRLSRRLLVPIGDDDLSRAATAYALEMARAFDSTLVFAALDAEHATPRALVAAACARAAAHGCPAEGIVVTAQGNASLTVAEHATIQECDAIVIASRMHEGFRRPDPGTVTEAVVYASNVPVLLVRAP